jgi:tetratricopeptide (TPR) repeat protein
MAHKKKLRILIALTITILMFGFCACAFFDPVQGGIALLNEGIRTEQHSDYYGAAKKYEEALKIFEKHNFKKGISAVIGNLGNVYWNFGQYQKALSYYEKALAINREIGDRNGEGINLGNIGNIYLNFGQYQKSLSYYEKSLVIRREIGDRNGEGDTLGNIGVVYQNLGQYQKSLSYYEKALAIDREIGDRNGEGATLGNIGIVYWNFGQYQKALSYHEKSLVIRREIGDRKGEGNNLISIGIVYWNFGQYQKALSYYEKALGINREIGNRNGEGNNLISIGNVYQNLGQYRKALGYYKKALVIDKEIGVPTGIVEGNIGDIYLETGDTDKAEKIYEKLGGLIRLGRLVRLGRLCLAKKDFHKSLEYFEKALQQDIKNRNAAFLFADYVGLGLSSEWVKNYGKAREFYLSAVKLTEEMRDSLAPGQRSHFFATKPMGFPRLEPYEGLVRVLNQLKQVGSSFHYAEYTKARSFAESIAGVHEGVPVGIIARLASEEKDIANQIVALYKQRQKAYSQNRMQAYENIEKLIKKNKEKQGELISKIRRDYPEYASIKYPQPLKVSEIALTKNEYLVEYEVTDTTTFAWLVHDCRIVKSVTIPISRKELTDLVKKYRAYFQVSRKSDLAQFDPKAGHRLYTLLMKDILSSVPKESHIIIVPDEILGVLPFEALVSEMPKRYQVAEGKKGSFPLGIRYVGDERNISYYQSGTALAMIRNLRQKTMAAKPMLVVADPVFDVSDVRLRGKTHLAKVTKYQMNLMRAVEDEGGFSFPRLEQTSVLARSLEKNFNNRVDVIDGMNANYAMLKKHDLKDYRYLVFATHGILDNQVPGIREPALVLTQVGNPEDEDGFLTMSEVMDLSLDDMQRADRLRDGIGQKYQRRRCHGHGKGLSIRGVKIRAGQPLVGSRGVNHEISRAVLLLSQDRKDKPGSPEIGQGRYPKRRLRAPLLLGPVHIDR